MTYVGEKWNAILMMSSNDSCIVYYKNISRPSKFFFAITNNVLYIAYEGEIRDW